MPTTRGARRSSRSPARSLGVARRAVLSGSASRTTRTTCKALAFLGFFINLFNLLPVVPLDGGADRRGAPPVALARRPRRPARARRLPAEPDADHHPALRGLGALAPLADPRPLADAASTTGRAVPAAAIAILYFGLAALLVLGMHATHVPRTLLGARWKTGGSSSADERRTISSATSQSIAREFRDGFRGGRADRPAGGDVFGSARVARATRAYEQARARSAGASREAGWAVVTGGGPGVMEAANRGAKEGGGLSVGFNIELPHEQQLNPYLDIAAHLPPLLRAQDDVREGRRGLRRLPRRLRHARTSCSSR